TVVGHDTIDELETQRSSIVSVFFFSSRRRHTRSKRDWSSDVCSSDLSLKERSVSSALKSSKKSLSLVTSPSTCRIASDRILRFRSEERRVGKECRSRGSRVF